MLIKWRFQLGDDVTCADVCEVDTLDHRAFELVGRAIVETMLLYAGADGYVDDQGVLQLHGVSVKVEIIGTD